MIAAREASEPERRASPLVVAAISRPFRRLSAIAGRLCPMPDRNKMVLRKSLLIFVVVLDVNRERG
jgi:hypothetical protein